MKPIKSGIKWWSGVNFLRFVQIQNHISANIKFSHLYLSHKTSIAMEQSEERKVDEIMPPAKVRGVKKLNRDDFQKDVSIPIVKVPIEKTQHALQRLKPFFLKMNGLQPVDDSEGGKVILLNPTLVQKHSNFSEILSHLELQLQYKDINLTYSNWSKDAILKSILPEDPEYGLTSFSIIGHILHLNLKEHMEDYKTVIAQVLLDKVPTIKTIIHKAKTIDETFRFFEIELLAGEPNFQACVKENGFKYEFDFSKVFWNPRLGHEHGEIVKRLQPGDVVFDVFSGVGPFSIPAAKKKCAVYANDLNPESIKWLNHSAKLNKIGDNLLTFNQDGKDFIRSTVKNKLQELFSTSKDVAVHILMNLPAIAIEFISCFKSLLTGFEIPETTRLPLLYCYFFVGKNESEDTLIEKYLDEESIKNIIEIKIVRNVAPNKKMFRLVFRISESFLCNECDNVERERKRIKLEK